MRVGLRADLKTKFNVSGELLAPSSLIDAPKGCA